jgi:hypothetical protein
MSCHSPDSLLPTFASLRRTQRPRLLLRTARIGLADYVRERDLKRILRLPAPPVPGPESVAALLELEEAQELMRTRPPAEVGEPWRATRHVEILIALIAEARLVFAPVMAPEMAPMMTPMMTPPEPALHLV